MSTCLLLRVSLHFSESVKKLIRGPSEATYTVFTAFLAAKVSEAELWRDTAASRTPPWLPSGWECRGRRLTLRCALLGRRAGITEQYNVGVIVHPKNAELLAVRGELKLSGRVCQEVRNLPA